MKQQNIVYHSAWGGVIVCIACGSQYSLKLRNCPNCHTPRGEVETPRGQKPENSSQRPKGVSTNYG